MAKYETCRRVVSVNNHEYLDVVEEVVNQLMQLPEKMVQEFANNDWHIFVTKGSIENHIGERNTAVGEPTILGITFWECRTIFMPILDQNDFSLEQIGHATIHEFGHYFDRARGITSKSYKFQQIYNAEDRIYCENIGTAANTDCAEEYFAETFAAYVLNGDRLKEYCPITYEYFRNIFFEYSDFR